MGSKSRWSRTAALIVGLAVFVALVAVPSIGLAAVPTVQGHVTNAAADSLPGIQVKVISAGSIFWSGNTVTDQAGAYSVVVPEEGAYNVEVHDSSGNYAAAPQYLTDVVASTPSIADFTMLHAGGISGRVVNAQGAPIAGVDVQSNLVLEGNPAQDGAAVTAADGKYTITGLLPGPHFVYFYDSLDRIAPQWYDGVGFDFNAATGVPVAEGAITPEINVGTYVAPVDFTITPTAGANGSIAPDSAQTVASGSSRTFTITADAGYHVLDVLVDDVSIGAVASHTFANVTGNHTIAATFEINSAGPVATTLTAKATAAMRRYKYVTISSILSGGVPAGSHVRYQLTYPGKHTWVTISSTRDVTATGYSSIRYKLTKKGTYYFRARFMGIDGFAGSISKSVKVVVK